MTRISSDPFMTRSSPADATTRPSKKNLKKVSNFNQTFVFLFLLHHLFTVMAVSPPPPPGSLPKCIPPSFLMKDTQPSCQNTSMTGKHSCSGGSQPSSSTLPPPPPKRILVKFKLPMEARFHLSKMPRPADDASQELKRAWIDSLTPPELKDDPEGLQHFYVAYNTYHDTRKKVMEKMTANFEQAVQDMHKAHPVSLYFQLRPSRFGKGRSILEFWTDVWLTC